MITIKKNGVEGAAYGFPFLGPMDHPLTVPVKINTLTTKEVDARGNLKPGVPLKIDGALCNAAVGEYVYGATIEPVKLASVAANPTNALLAANAGTQLVTVGVIGIYQRDVCEDNLDRALTAAELAAFKAAGCHLVLSRT